MKATTGMSLLTSSLLLSFKVGCSATVCNLLIAVPCAWFAYRKRTSWWVLVLESLAVTPILVPPIVLGFFLLLALGPHSPFYPVFQTLWGHGPLYHYSGLVLAAMVYSFPLMFAPLQAGLEQIPSRCLHSLYTLGYTPTRVFYKAVLPWLRPAIAHSSILGFSHSLGAFGVMLLVGGSIPGRTQVLSIYLFQQIELLEYREVLQVSLFLVLLAIVLTALCRRLARART